MEKEEEKMKCKHIHKDEPENAICEDCLNSRCANCGKKIRRDIYPRAKFCSRSCRAKHWLSKNPKLKFHCPISGNKFYVPEEDCHCFCCGIHSPFLHKDKVPEVSMVSSGILNPPIYKNLLWVGFVYACGLFLGATTDLPLLSLLFYSITGWLIGILIALSIVGLNKK